MLNSLEDLIFSGHFVKLADDLEGTGTLCFIIGLYIQHMFLYFYWFALYQLGAVLYSLLFYANVLRHGSYLDIVHVD